MLIVAPLSLDRCDVKVQANLPRIAIDENNPITSVTDNDSLPSTRLGNSGNFRLRHYGPLNFGRELPSSAAASVAACAATGRLIEISRSINDNYSIGMARRKCSMWQQIEAL
jgi:hypothetical protein